MDKMIIEANGRQHFIWGLASAPDADHFAFCEKNQYTKYSLAEITAAVETINTVNRDYLEFLAEYDGWMVKQYDENWADWLLSTVQWTPAMRELEDIRTDFDTREVNTETSKKYSRDAFPVKRWLTDCNKLARRVKKMRTLFLKIQDEITNG